MFVAQRMGVAGRRPPGPAGARDLLVGDGDGVRRPHRGHRHRSAGPDGQRWPASTEAFGQRRSVCLGLAVGPGNGSTPASAPGRERLPSTSDGQCVADRQRRRGYRARHLQSRRGRHAPLSGRRDRPGDRARDRGSDGIALGRCWPRPATPHSTGGSSTRRRPRVAITYIDGDAGILRYRGYPIEQLAEKSTFIEVSYLLIYGELPTTDELEKFTTQIQRHTLLHEDLKRFFDGFPRNAHPMPVLSSAVNALSAYYQDSLDPFDPEQVELSTIRLLAKLPTIAAYAYKKSVGQPFLYPDNSLSLVENFLRMTFGFPAEPYQVDPEVVRALDMLLILHADHEQNCSTSTVRLVGSSQANLFTSISGGINALWGPLHGGANQAVLEMLREDQDRRRRRRRVRPQGQEPRRRREADGLRAPRLQELRPARADRQGAGRQDPRQARRRRPRCSTSPRRSRRRR